jgi:O-antigen ligase
MASLGRKSPVVHNPETGLSSLLQLIPIPLRWLRLIIVLGVLVMAPALSYVMVKQNPLYGLVAAVAPLGLLGVYLLLARLDLTPLIILAAAAFVPLALPTGTGSDLVFSLIVTAFVVGLWLMRMLISEKRIHLSATPVNVPLLGFIAATLVSLVWGNVFRDLLVVTSRTFPLVQAASATVMIMLPGAFLLTANQLNDLRLVKLMAGVMLVAGALGLIRQYGYADIPVNISGLFNMWVISLSVGLGVFNRQLPLVWRVLLLTLAGLWIFWGVILHLSWLAGWLPGLVALSVLTFLRSKRHAALLVVVGIIAVGINQVYYSAVVTAEVEESGLSRLAAWGVNWRITGEHLLFGTGPAGYAAYYMSYFPREAMATHSNYIDILSQTGLVGFGFYIAFFLILAWRGYKLCLRLKNRGDFTEGMASAALAGTAACIVAMGLGDWLIPFAYTQTIEGFDHAVYSWLLMSVILVLERLTAADANSIPHA